MMETLGTGVFDITPSDSIAAHKDGCAQQNQDQSYTKTIKLSKPC